MQGLRIGELASRTGVSAKTVRYYDLLGLLPAAERSESGYRLYGEREVTRLNFIRKAKRAGLSLDEIRAILALSDHGERPCQEVRSAIGRKIAQIDRQIAELRSCRDGLIRLQEEAEQVAELPAAICPVIERGGDGLALSGSAQCGCAVAGEGRQTLTPPFGHPSPAERERGRG